MPVSDSEEDETEEGVEGSTKKGKEISHARNDLRKDESNNPDTSYNRNPNTPSDDGVAVCVSRLAHDSKVDEFGTDVRIDDTDDNGGDDDEGEGALLVGGDTQTAESWGGGVLAQVSESNCRRNDEQEGGNGSKDSERLGEVLWSFHLSNEGGKEDLRDPEKSDVQDGIHASDPGGASEREGIGPDRSIGRVVTVVSIKRSFLNPSKDEEEKNGESHAGRCESRTTIVSKTSRQGKLCGERCLLTGEHRHKRDMAQGPRYGHHDTYEHHDDRKDNSALRVIRQGVEDLGTGKDVEADKNNVVGK